jgi:hypothetical protein
MGEAAYDACQANSSAYSDSDNLHSVMNHSYVRLLFRAAIGLVHYPVDRSQLSQLRIVNIQYRPMDHFTRQLVIPQIKLHEWVTSGAVLESATP